MFSKIVSMIFVVVFLAACGMAFAMNKTDKSGNQAIAAIGGKVTAIKGNIVTVRDNKGIETHIELNSAAGIKIGQNAWCEVDCGKGMRIGDKNVQVKKVMGNGVSR